MRFRKPVRHVQTSSGDEPPAAPVGSITTGSQNVPVAKRHFLSADESSILADVAANGLWSRSDAARHPAMQSLRERGLVIVTPTQDGQEIAVTAPGRLALRRGWVEEEA